MLAVPIDLSDKRDAGQGVTTNRLCQGVGYSLRSADIRTINNS